MLSIMANIDIEAVLRQHPDVRDGAIVPFYDQSLASDVPKAFGVYILVSILALTDVYIP